MPFTPFHMGAALVLKPAARQHFSLFAFGVAQIPLGACVEIELVAEVA